MTIQSSVIEAAPQRISRNRPWRFMLLSCLTLGLYSAFLALRDGRVIGQLVGKRRVGLGLGLVLTVATLGIFPGIYVVVLAFDLQLYSEVHNTARRQPHLGSVVMAADLLSLLAAAASGGVAVIVSVALWSYGCCLLFNELGLYASNDA